LERMVGLWSDRDKTVVVHFPNKDRRKIGREDIPSDCGHGHPLTPDNLRIDRSEEPCAACKAAVIELKS